MKSSELDIVQKLDRYEQALLRLAHLPDRSGHTYGSRLHDVGAMTEEARKALGPLGRKLARQMEKEVAVLLKKNMMKEYFLLDKSNQK
jgi:hypothetical protein